MTETGHNSKEQLKSVVERIERLGEEIKDLQSDQRDIYAEAKGNGFDVKALRQIIRIRAEDPNKRAEREAILETYMQTLGML
jgi:uncharacterized protein (UPF0335 family)